MQKTLYNTGFTGHRRFSFIKYNNGKSQASLILLLGNNVYYPRLRISTELFTSPSVRGRPCLCIYNNILFYFCQLHLRIFLCSITFNKLSINVVECIVTFYHYFSVPFNSKSVTSYYPFVTSYHTF